MEAFIPLVGTHFRGSEAKQLVNDLIPGADGFTFEREPDNEYDPDAIAVYIDDCHVGYLARTHNGALACAMDDGASPSATVVDFEGRKPILHVIW